MGDVGPIQARGRKSSGKALFMQVFHEMSEIAYLTAEFACNVCFGDYENSFIFQSSWITKWIKSCASPKLPPAPGYRPAPFHASWPGKRIPATRRAGRCWTAPASWVSCRVGRRASAAQSSAGVCPQRAFDERSDIFYYRVIQSINNALAAHEVRLRYCALDENDSDANLFLPA